MNKEKLIEIIENFSREKVVEVRQITGKGLVNDIYCVTTSSNKYIFRCDPNEGNTKRFKKEAWCIQQASKLGVLGPEVLSVDMTDSHPYMLMSYIEGTNGEDVNDSKMIWRKLGEYARKIHSIEVQGFSENMVSPGVFDDNWDRFLDYNINSLNPNDKLLKAAFITEKQSEHIKKIFLGLKDFDFRFGLIHHDLSLNNTIIDEKGSVYLLDWGSSQVSVTPHLDIAEILDSSLSEQSEEFQAFLKGYVLEYAEYEKIKPEISQLNVLVYMDKLRWAADRRPEKIEHMRQELQKRLAKINM